MSFAETCLICRLYSSHIDHSWGIIEHKNVVNSLFSLHHENTHLLPRHVWNPRSSGLVANNQDHFNQFKIKRND